MAKCSYQIKGDFNFVCRSLKQQILDGSTSATLEEEEYKTYGGYLSLYLQYTVFGQVYEGMEVVDKIAAVETSQNSSYKDKPLEDVIIESIEVTEYK